MVIISSNPVVVDYSRNLATMIEAGSYEHVSPHIKADNFLMEGEGAQEVETFLVQFWNWDIMNDRALAELDKYGYRPANIAELLAFGERYPQREYPIVALGSVCRPPDGGRAYPFIVWGEQGRRLGLRNYGIIWHGGWSDYYRFLAVRK